MSVKSKRHRVQGSDSIRMTPVGQQLVCSRLSREAWENAGALALPLLILTQRTAESSIKSEVSIRSPTPASSLCCSPNLRTTPVTLGYDKLGSPALQAPSLWGQRSEVRSQGATEEEKAQGPLCLLLLGPDARSRRPRRGDCMKRAHQLLMCTPRNASEFERHFVQLEVRRSIHPARDRDEVLLSKVPVEACQAEGARDATSSQRLLISFINGRSLMRNDRRREQLSPSPLTYKSPGFRLCCSATWTGGPPGGRAGGRSQEPGLLMA